MSGVEEGQRFFDPGLSVPAVDVSGLTWHEADDARFSLEGFWWRRPGGAFRRLPLSSAERTLPAGVDGLAWHSSGGCLRFRSDCGRIVVRARMASANLIVRMAMTGSMGFDLYADGTCRGVSRFRIGEGDFVAEVFAHGERRMRDFTLYFPTYARLTSLELGFDAQARFEEPCAWPDPRPIVAYGTSILQGACANRPGMAYTNLLSRTLGRPGRGHPRLQVHRLHVRRRRLLRTAPLLRRGTHGMDDPRPAARRTHGPLHGAVPPGPPPRRRHPGLRHQPRPTAPHHLMTAPLKAGRTPLRPPCVARL